MTDKRRLDAAQIHDVDVDWGEHVYHAAVLWEPLNDEGEYTAEVLAVFFDEWAPERQALHDDALWAFWYDWRHGLVKLYI